MQQEIELPISDELAARHTEHHLRLLRYLMHITRQKELSEDLAQETWLRALVYRHQYRGEVPYDAWLRSIARNLYIDRCRRSAIIQFRTLEPLSEEEYEVQPYDASPSPLVRVLHSELSEQLSRSLARLDEDTQALLVEKFMKERPLSELACRCGIPLATAKSKVYRGLKRLRGPLQALSPRQQGPALTVLK